MQACTKSRRGGWLVAMFLAAGVVPAGGQPPSPRTPGALPNQPSTRPAPEASDPIPADIDALLENLTDTYQKARSYHDRGRVMLRQRTGRVTVTTEMPIELTFRRPNLLLLEAGQYTIACDAKTLYMVIPELGEYTAVSAPAKLTIQHIQLGAALPGSEEGHPDILELLLSPAAHENLVKQIVSIAWGENTLLDGRTCRQLVYETTQGTKVRLFVDPARMVLMRISGEVSTALRRQEAGASRSSSTPQPQELTFNYDLSPLSTDETLEESAFAFSPPANLRRVAQFSQMGPAREQPTTGPQAADREGMIAGAHLLGKLAPPLSGTDQRGQKLSPEDLQGKAVLVFFWSLAGSPHDLLAIPIVQRVADRFEKHPGFMVLGISLGNQPAQQAKEVLAAKKATFRTLVEPDPRLGMTYRLGGTPTFVLIDPDGMVRWALLGAPPELEETLVSEGQKLLAPTN